MAPSDSSSRCPGQNQQMWTPEAIQEIACCVCGRLVEIWKDEPLRLCPACGNEVENPAIDMGCAKHCAAAAQCLAARRRSDRGA